MRPSPRQAALPEHSGALAADRQTDRKRNCTCEVFRDYLNVGPRLVSGVRLFSHAEDALAASRFADVTQPSPSPGSTLFDRCQHLAGIPREPGGRREKGQASRGGFVSKHLYEH